MSAPCECALWVRVDRFLQLKINQAIEKNCSDKLKRQLQRLKKRMAKVKRNFVREYSATMLMLDAAKKLEEAKGLQTIAENAQAAAMAEMEDIQSTPEDDAWSCVGLSAGDWGE